LTGCATAGFDANGLAACPPVAEYSQEFQAQAAEELALLPDASVIVVMMGDYAVMRDQAGSCKRPKFWLDVETFNFELRAEING